MPPFVSVTNGNYTWTKTYNYNDFDFGTARDTLSLTAIDTNNNTTIQGIEIDIIKEMICPLLFHLLHLVKQPLIYIVLSRPF